MIVHEDYDGYTVENDIALIILESALTMNSKVAEINIPEGDASSFYADGAAITVAGTINYRYLRQKNLDKCQFLGH